jgi:hypothetical protein
MTRADADPATSVESVDADDSGSTTASGSS